MHVTIALIFLSIGAVLNVAATFFFRNPDVPFSLWAGWVNPEEFYGPRGLVLNRVGSALIVVGFVVLYVPRIFGS